MTRACSCTDINTCHKGCWWQTSSSLSRLNVRACACIISTGLCMDICPPLSLYMLIHMSTYLVYSFLNLSGSCLLYLHMQQTLQRSVWNMYPDDALSNTCKEKWVASMQGWPESDALTPDITKLLHCMDVGACLLMSGFLGDKGEGNE